MGWRPWNSFRNNIDQETQQLISDALAVRNRTVAGESGLVSLFDLGYSDVGIDEGWEFIGPKNRSMHDKEGNPLIDLSTFPNLTALADHVHSNNQTISWYLNSCAFGGPKNDSLTNYEGDVRALIRYGFDGVKIDGCGKMNNMTLYASLMRASNHSFAIENCHGGGDVDQGQNGLLPTTNYCPWNRFRTSNDIQAFVEAWFWNMQTTLPYLDSEHPISQPSCWAYPDMLETGLVREPARSASEVQPTHPMPWNRAHFGGWVIVSSPLILGLNILNQTQLEAVIDVIGNREAIRINQEWAGHPGTLAHQWSGKDLPIPNATYVWSLPCDEEDESQLGWEYNALTQTLARQRHDTHGQGYVSYDQSLASTLLTLTSSESMTGLSTRFVYDNVTRTLGNPSGYVTPPYSGRGICLASFGWQLPTCGDTPSAKMYACLGDQTDQKWVLNSNGTVSNDCGQCLATRHVPQSPDTSVQLWIKPQLPSEDGSPRVAALLINNSPWTFNATIDFELLKLNRSEKNDQIDNFTSNASARVRDVWMRRDFENSFRNKFIYNLPSFDSGLFIFKFTK